MSLSVDQQIDFLAAIGTWVAGIATFFAVVVSLYLARRGESLRVLKRVSKVHLVSGVENRSDFISVKVTNLGNRPILVDGIGWSMGKGKDRQEFFQNTDSAIGNTIPCEINYGKSGTFLISLESGWAERFLNQNTNVDDASLRSLRALVFLSIGKTIKIKPEENVLEYLRSVRESSASNPQRT